MQLVALAHSFWLARVGAAYLLALRWPPRPLASAANGPRVWCACFAAPKLEAPLGGELLPWARGGEEEQQEEEEGARRLATS